MPAQEAFTIPLIAIEGIDGAGKTTLLDGLKDDPDLHRLAFTGEFASPVGQHLRDIEGWHGDPVIKLYLFAADRACIFRDLAARAARPSAIVWDRYVASALVYRESERLVRGWPHGREDAERINRIFPAPVRTILLELDPAEADRRKGSIAGITEKAAELYSKMAREDDSWCIVNATASREKVRSDVKEILLAVA